MLECDARGKELCISPLGYSRLRTRRTIWVKTYGHNPWTMLAAPTENHIVPVMLFPPGGTYGETEETDDPEKFCDVCLGTEIDPIETVNSAITIDCVLYNSILRMIDLPLNTKWDREVSAEIAAEMFDLFRKKKKVVVHAEEKFSVILVRKEEAHLARCGLSLLDDDDPRIFEMDPIPDMYRWIVVAENNFADRRCLQ